MTFQHVFGFACRYRLYLVAQKQVFLLCTSQTGIQPGSKRARRRPGEAQERETKEKKYSLDDSEDAMNCFFVRLLQMLDGFGEIVRFRSNLKTTLYSQDTSTLIMLYLTFAFLCPRSAADLYHFFASRRETPIPYPFSKHSPKAF